MTENTPIKTIPGAHVMNGVTYLNTTKGDLRRVDGMSAKDLLIHEQVYNMIVFAKGLAAEIARFKAHTFADLEALDAMLAQEYGVTRKDGAKGNRTFTSGDGRYQVSIKINTPEVVGPELQQAKALIDEIVLEKGAAADPVLAALVAQAFDVGKQGRVNTDMLRRLKKLEIDDPRWPSIQRAIGDAITDGVSKSYITFHQWRDAAGGWQMIPLNIAAVEITDDAFDHPSLRRQVEEMTAAIAAQTGRIPDFPDLPPAAAVQHLVDWVLGLDADADADDQDDFDTLPPRLVDDLYCAEELLGMVFPHLESAATHEGVDVDKIAGVVSELKANLSILQAMFADAKATIAQAAE